ncbi:hypothetical protein DL98DRAFT_441283, partial [Cadophora sp. DSE1049]
EELRVFIRVLICIKVYKKPRINIYWNLDKNKGLIYTISTYIILNRYKEIKRYYYIFNAVDNKR